MDGDGVENQFANLEIASGGGHNHQIVEAVRDVPNRVKAPSDVPKEQAIAAFCRDKGDEYYKRKLYFDAIVAYNRSIAHAATGSSELGLLYAKRSAIYFDVKIYSKCIENIRLARENQFPAERMAELDERAKACTGKADDVFDPWGFFKLSHPPNRRIPFVVKCLELRESLTYGRHIVTNEALKAGDIIAIEEPYFAMWYKMSDVYRCKVCMSLNHGSLVPCPHCAKVMYCSERCRNDDTIHGWKHKDPPKNFDNCTERYHRSTLMQALATKITGAHVDETAAFVLNKCPKTVFDYNWANLDDSSYNKSRLVCINSLTKVPMAGSGKLTHQFTHDQSLIFENNYFHMYEIRRDVLDPIHDTFYKHLVGSAIYPFAALLNNSCYPNVQQITVQNKSVLVVSRPIAASEQLFVSYGYPFHSFFRDDRRKSLRQHYNFSCTCEACANDYEPLPKLKKADKKFNEQRFKTSPSVRDTLYLLKKNCAYINKNIKTNQPSFEIVKLMEQNDELLHNLARADFF